MAFPKSHIKLFHALETLNLSSFFHMCYFKNPVQQNVPLIDEMTRVFSTSTGISGVSLVYHISKTSTVTYPFYCNFERDIGEERLRKVLEKITSMLGNLFSLRSHLNRQQKPLLILYKKIVTNGICFYQKGCIWTKQVKGWIN